MTSLKDIGSEAHAINQKNGWEVFTEQDWPQHRADKEPVQKLCTHMALVHSEVSEATEAVRKIDRANFEEELADVIIRVASIAFGMGIDLGSAVETKLAVNATRGLHHGGKTV